MDRDVHNYEDACSFSASELDLAIINTVRACLSAGSYSSYVSAHNRLHAYLFRSAELKGFYGDKHA